MKLALAQIDGRLGDLEGICSRIEDQVAVAAKQGARVLCTPAPLFTGVLPGTFFASGDFEHSLLFELSNLAQRIKEHKVICLVPAVVGYEETPMLEMFMLKDGRVIPARTSVARRRQQAGAREDDLWLPPVFDVAGVRIAVTFDVKRDLPRIPAGCDLVIYFQADAFSAADRDTAGAASVSDGQVVEAVRKRSVWLACMAPVGAFDDCVYVGGSYVMDDAGRVLAVAPSFEEALVVQDIQRGVTHPCLSEHELPTFNREDYTWQALVLALRDTVAAKGVGRVAVALDGKLPSALMAALCVDALGPRNVLGLVVTNDEVSTSSQQAAEADRMNLIRTVCDNLHIRLFERGGVSANRLLDRDVPVSASPRVLRSLEGLYLEDLAHASDALAVASFTKTGSALIAPALCASYQGDIAPFGDVYLTELEFLARARNRSSAVLPAQLVSLAHIDSCMQGIIALSVADRTHNDGYSERILQLFASLQPGQIDGTLESYVDRKAAFDATPLGKSNPRATALLFMLVRRGEFARRSLPLTPMVSACAFSMRLWPRSLAWLDTGLEGKERLTVSSLAQAEIERFEAKGEAAGERVREEIMDMLGGMLGISAEQMEELRSEEGQKRMRENMQKFEGQVQEAIEKMMGAAVDDADERSHGEKPSGPDQSQGFEPGVNGFTFFSDN